MKDASTELLEVYALASGGDREAYAFLLMWHGWCHAIDDFVDEPNHGGHHVVDLCADAVVLCASPFWLQHSNALGPIMATVAEKYRASLQAGRTALSDALRIAGNDLVLAVAYIRGGRPLAAAVSNRLWPIVERTQLVPE